MKRLVFTTLFALIAGAAPAAAQGTSLVKIGITGGWVTPYQTTKTYAKTGWDAGLTMQIAAPLVPIGFRIDALYSTMDGAAQTGAAIHVDNFTIYSATGNVVWTVFGTGMPTKFYVIGGIGYYSVSQKQTVVATSTSATVSSSDFGYNIGLGVKLTKFFIEARWTNIDGGLLIPSTGASQSLQIVPINVGIIF